MNFRHVLYWIVILLSNIPYVLSVNAIQVSNYYYKQRIVVFVMIHFLRRDSTTTAAISPLLLDERNLVGILSYDEDEDDENNNSQEIIIITNNNNENNNNAIIGQLVGSVDENDNNNSDHINDSTTTTCHVLDDCHRCTNTDKDIIPECVESGRVITYSCGPSSSSFVLENTLPKDFNIANIPFPVASLKQKLSSTIDISHSMMYYQSCRRTVDDEEFLLMRFQVFCFLAGTIAFISVRRQKAQHASLFDQRGSNSRQSNSQIVQANGRRRNDQNNTSIEMIATSMSSQTNNRDEIMKSSLTDHDETADMV